MRQSRIVIDLIFVTTFLVIVNFILLGFVLFYIPLWFEVPTFKAFAWFGIINATLWIVVEFSLAIYVLFKQQHQRTSVDTNTDVDFARLVALIALVFCGCALVNVTFLRLRLDANDPLEAYQNGDGMLWNLGAVTFNSSSNIFVYFVACRNFRAAFFKFFGCCKNRFATFLSNNEQTD